MTSLPRHRSALLATLREIRDLLTEIRDLLAQSEERPSKACDHAFDVAAGIRAALLNVRPEISKRVGKGPLVVGHGSLDSSVAPAPVGSAASASVAPEAAPEGNGAAGSPTGPAAPGRGLS